jgi:hypothetical protein
LKRWVEDYAKQITGLTATPIDTSKFAPQVAGQVPLQQRAATLAGQGIGAYQPYIAEAQRLGGVDSTTGKITQTGTTKKLYKLLCLHIKHNLLIQVISRIRQTKTNARTIKLVMQQLELELLVVEEKEFN